MAPRLSGRQAAQLLVPERPHGAPEVTACPSGSGRPRPVPQKPQWKDLSCSEKESWVVSCQLNHVRVRPRGWRVGPSGWHPRLREGLAPSRVGWRPCNAACAYQNGLWAGAGCARTGGALPAPTGMCKQRQPRPSAPALCPPPCLPVPSQRPAGLLRLSGTSRPSTAASSCPTGRPAWCWSGRDFPSRTC